MRDSTDHKAKSWPALGTAMPESLADRFMHCPVCREDYDLGDLGEVLQHLHAGSDENEID